MHATKIKNTTGNVTFSSRYDFWLLTVALSLLCLGIIMVASSSITIADRIHNDPLYYFWRQLFAVFIGFLFAGVILKIPSSVWERFSTSMLFTAIALLVLVLIPGIGREVNGSMRWIDLGAVNLQSSEPVKIFIITYIAGYMVRHTEQLRLTFSGFIKPIGVVTLISGLLLLEPDYGAAVVIFLTTLGMLFMGGIPLSRFFVWMLVALSALASLAVLSPYRLNRLTAFIDPWQDPFNSGFQLTQALIAFGRGEWFGAGLGSSIQKLFYLPEAHTDFVFAVLAEELGLIFTVTVILMFFFIVWRAFVIAQIANKSGRSFASFMAYGIGLVLGIQAFINMGVNTGLLPTKGLTLPLLSYGSNSVIISCMLIAMLLRIEFENRHSSKEAIPEPVMNYAA